MPEWIYILVNAVVLLAITILNSKGNLWDQRKKGILKFNRRGKAVASLSIIILAISIIQSEQNQRRIRYESKLNDSAIRLAVKNTVDSMKNEIIYVFESGMESQSQFIDSSIARAKKKENYTPINVIAGGPDPVIGVQRKSFEFLGDKVPNSSFVFHVYMKEASATNFDLKLYAFGVNTEGHEFAKVHSVPKDYLWSPNTHMAFGIGGNLDNTPLKLSVGYIHGTYSSFDRTRNYNVDLMYTGNPNSDLGYSQIFDPVEKEKMFQRILATIAKNESY